MSSLTKFTKVTFWLFGIILCGIYMKLNDSIAAIYMSRTTGPTKPYICLEKSQNLSSLSGMSCSDCSLSLLESDGWFCEFDNAWNLRKRNHRIQNRRNHASDIRNFFFLHNWHPTIHCEFEERIGVGDGGKWVCDLHKIRTFNLKLPLIYSFGSNGDFRFEKEIKIQVPQAEIHTFDQAAYDCPKNICTFHQMTLGSGEASGSKSLKTIMKDLKHGRRPIDILKVDIEGAEFDLFHAFFNSTTSRKTKNGLRISSLPYIRQILVEIHLRNGGGEEESQRAHSFFEAFRRNNYAIFHKEANLNECQNVFEYGFIRLNPMFFFES